MNANTMTQSAKMKQTLNQFSETKTAAALQGAQIYRSRRDLSQRFGSVDENQFIKKGQEMVHQSFGEDELSRSHLSMNKSTFNASYMGGKDDPVIVDWSQQVNNDQASKVNKPQARTQASLQDAREFLSQHISMLDAVSEVDSQGQTPAIGAEGSKTAKHIQAHATDMTLRISNEKETVPKLTPNALLQRQISQNQVLNQKAKDSNMLIGGQDDAMKRRVASDSLSNYNEDNTGRQE